MTINDEFDESEKLDSYEEPESIVEQPVEAEQVASTEEVTEENEQIAGDPEQPEQPVDSVESPSVDVDNPEIGEIPSSVDQVAEPFPSPDAAEESPPDFPELPEPVSTDSSLVEAPSVGVESFEVAAAPEVAETAESPVEPEPVVQDEPSVPDAPEVEAGVTEDVQPYEASVEQPQEVDIPEVSASDVESIEPPSVAESVDDVPEPEPHEQESAEFKAFPTPSDSAEPLSVPPVVEDPAPSETLQEVMDEPVGFQGETTHPDVPEAGYSPVQQSDEGNFRDNDKAVFAQMQRSQESADALAGALVANLDPVFEQMRTVQEFTVQDYMQRQLVETTIISRLR